MRPYIRNVRPLWYDTCRARHNAEPPREGHTMHNLATIGTGKSVHLAYYVGDKLTGTYCDRAAWESKRVRTIEGGAELATCSRCAKVAASPESVPNTVYGELAVVPELVEKSGPSHDPARCAVPGCMWFDGINR